MREIIIFQNDGRFFVALYFGEVINQKDSDTAELADTRSMIQKTTGERWERGGGKNDALLTFAGNGDVYTVYTSTGALAEIHTNFRSGRGSVRSPLMRPF